MSTQRWNRLAAGDYVLRGSVAEGLPVLAEVYQDTQDRWHWYTSLPERQRSKSGMERTLAEAKQRAEEALA